MRKLKNKKTRSSSPKIGLIISLLMIMSLCAACGETSNAASNSAATSATAITTTNNQDFTVESTTADATTTQPVVTSKKSSPTAGSSQADNVAAGSNIPAPASTPTAIVAPTSTPAPTIMPSLLPITGLTPMPYNEPKTVGKGTIFEGQFFSPTLNKNVPYQIYLPPGYSDTNQRYPVLYMLHGSSGSYREWYSYDINDTADKLITDGTIKPMIIMMPSGDVGFWMDAANGGPQYGSYVAHDVVQFTDANFRTIPDRDNRAIGGHSMGGFGSLSIAFNYPDLFSVVGSHSPALRSLQDGPPFFGDAAWFAKYDPMELAQSLPIATLKSFKIWIDIGNQDTEWLPQTQQLNNILNSRGIPHIWNVFGGSHGRAYWVTYSPKYLEFYADNLSGK